VAKRVRVKLFGHQNRGVLVDSEATKGAVVGLDLRYPDGTLVPPENFSGDGGGHTVLPEVMPTLWELILNIPVKIKNFLALSGTGYIYQVDDVLSLGVGAGSTDWPLHDIKIELGETLTIPDEKQYILWQRIEIEGSLVVEAGGELVLLDEGLPEPTDPDFTYVLGDLTQIDYDAGEQKTFTYDGGGDLIQVDYIQDGTTLRKDLVYSGGDLDYIDEYYV
jgi:hypothetical protein